MRLGGMQTRQQRPGAIKREIGAFWDTPPPGTPPKLSNKAIWISRTGPLVRHVLAPYPGSHSAGVRLSIDYRASDHYQPESKCLKLLRKPHIGRVPTAARG